MMIAKKILIVAMILLCLNFTSAPGVLCQDLGTVTVRACGSHLSEVISLVCNSNYNSYANDQPIDWKERHKLFITTQKAMNFLKIRRKRDGVVNECCFKSCTIDEMKSFCAPASTVSMAFLICLCLPTVIHSLPGYVAGPIQLCGSQLSDFIGLVCNFNYYSYGSRGKRETETEERFISEKKARSFLKLQRVHKRGVVNECCLRPCSIDELKLYCAE